MNIKKNSTWQCKIMPNEYKIFIDGNYVAHVEKCYVNNKVDHILKEIVLDNKKINLNIKFNDFTEVEEYIKKFVSVNNFKY